jgi:hypothetical protein
MGEIVAVVEYEIWGRRRKKISVSLQNVSVKIYLTKMILFFGMQGSCASRGVTQSVLHVLLIVHVAPYYCKTVFGDIC